MRYSKHGATLLLAIIMLIISGCESEVKQEASYGYFYNNVEYVLEDPFGGAIGTQWQFPFKDKSDTSIVRIFFWTSK